MSAWPVSFSAQLPISHSGRLLPPPSTISHIFMAGGERKPAHEGFVFQFFKFLPTASAPPHHASSQSRPTPAPSPIAIIVVTHRKELRNEQMRPPFLTGIVGPATVARPRPSAAHAV